MTQTTIAKHIPAGGLTHSVGDVELSVIPTAQAGYRIQGRRNGAFAPDLSSGHTFETHALTEWNRLVAKYPVAVETVTTAPALTPAAKGTVTKVSDPGHTALVIAEMTGRVERGGKPGQYSVRVLTALARRGYLTLTYQQGRTDARNVVTGGVLTHAGRVRLGQLTAAERAAADFDARLGGGQPRHRPARECLKGKSMKRYLLADVVTIELRPVSGGCWAHYSVTHVMSDGYRQAASAVNTVEQAVARAADLHPNATVEVTAPTAA